MAALLPPQIYDPESCTDGWFKLLDERKGNLQNVQFIPKLKTAQSGRPKQAPKAVAQPKVVNPGQGGLKSIKKPKDKGKAPTRQPPKKVTAADFTFTKVLDDRFECS